MMFGRGVRVRANPLHLGQLAVFEIRQVGCPWLERTLHLWIAADIASGLRHKLAWGRRPLAQFRTRWTDSAAVMATGTAYLAGCPDRTVRERVSGSICPQKGDTVRLGGSTTSAHGVLEPGSEFDGLDGQPIERYKRYGGI